MSERCDALVVGGGAAGAAAALDLAELGRDVVLVDRRAPAGIEGDAPLDPRVVAISPGSRALLDALGAWDRLDADRIAPYHRMQVAAGRGEVAFLAGDHGFDALGWIVEIPALVDALWAGLRGHRRIRIHAPVEVESISIDDSTRASEARTDPCGARVRLADRTRIETDVLIGADGAHSRVRAAASIRATIDDYNQRALVTHLTTERANRGIAWQRFTALGPLAQLPLPAGRSSLVWSVPRTDAERLMSLAEDAFIEELNEHAQGGPFGAVIAAEKRHALPLIRRRAETLAAGCIGLVGDAARTVHPLAGQGLNLGLADVAVLAETFGRHRTDPQRALARYALRRGSDAALVAGGIHALTELRGFGPMAIEGLGAGFSMMKRSRLARGLFVRRACGLGEVEGGVQALQAR